MIYKTATITVTLAVLATSIFGSAALTTAYAQTDIQTGTQNLQETIHYMQVISALASACTSAATNHDMTMVASCLSITNQVHDSLKSVMDQNKAAIQSIILGP